MYQVLTDNVISIVKGDYIKIPIELHTGKFPKWVEVELEEDDIVYFGVMLPNTSFDKAILKKKFTLEDVDEHNNLIITLLPEDTMELSTGTYYYEIKLWYKDSDEVEHIDTIIQKSRFIVC